jgi:hypothetical protein
LRKILLGDWSPVAEYPEEYPVRGYRASTVARLGNHEFKVLSVGWVSSILLVSQV